MARDKTPNTEDLLIDQIAALQNTIADHEAQSRKMWKLHGLPK
jgi:hypothetical protein